VDLREEVVVATVASPPAVGRGREIVEERPDLGVRVEFRRLLGGHRRV
jgi:hypothetical protein